MVMVIKDSLIEEAHKILSEDPILVDALRESPVEYAGSLMSNRIEPGVETFDGMTPYWAQFKEEMHLFLCTDDPKYVGAREDIDNIEDATRKFVVPGIAGYIGAAMGVGAAVLTPFVALALIATVKVGMNAWCKVHSNKEPEFTDSDDQPIFLQNDL